MGNELICTNCQQENPEDAAYCMQCGSSLIPDRLFSSHDSRLSLSKDQNLNGMDVLTRHLDALLAGIGSVVVISGDAFVGKSHLVQLWHEQINKQGLLDKITWLENTSAEDPSLPNDVFIRNLLISLQSAMPNGQTKAHTDLTIQESNPPCDDIFSSSHSGITSTKPAIIIMDNLQAIDANTAKQLAEISQFTYRLPLLLCLIIRTPAQSIAWELVNNLSKMNHAHFSQVHCYPLDLSDTRKLIKKILNTKRDPPNTLTNQIFNLTGGNPGFVIEVMHSLVDSQTIKRINKLWVIPQEIGKLPIPSAFHRYFVPIFESLPEDAQKVLQVAAILGAEFSRKVLCEMLNQFEWGADKDESLVTLEEHKIIFINQVEPEITFRFSDPILREVVIDLLDQAQSKAYHALAASVIIKNYPTQLDTLATRLADHYLKAEDTNNAGLFYANAASNAMDRHSYTLAEINYRKALSVCTDPENHAWLNNGLGESLALQSMHSDAIEVWKQAAKIFLDTNQLTQLAEVYARMARSAWWMKDYSLCLSLCEEGLARTENSPESAQLAMLIHETGRAYFFTGDVQKSQKYCEEALRMAKDLGSQKIQADVLATMGILPTLPKRKAVAALQASIRMAENNNLKDIASRAYVNLAAIMEEMGEIRLARSHRIKALRAGKQNIPFSDEALMISSIINSDIWLGEFEDARNHLSQLRQLNQWRASSENLETNLLRLEAQIEQHLGNISRAIELFSLIAKKAEANHDFESLSMANYSLAEILLESVFFEEGSIPAEKLATASSLIPVKNAQVEFETLDHRQMSQTIVIKALQGDVQQALNLLELMKSGDAHPDGISSGIITLTEARVLGASNNLKMALTTYEKCLGLFKKMEALWWLAHTRLEMAVLHISRNEPEDIETAQSLLRESLSGFNQMGCAYYPDVIIDNLRIVRQQFRQQAITNRENKRELDQAGKAQTSFIPSKLPALPGWQIAAALQPAKETSGDFFDFIPLPGEKTGIVVADVGDKGAGAALYMAMCRTLFRGYAPTYPDDPAAVIAAVNQRILTDTRDGIFLTAVYAILDTEKSEIIYANAGHNPPCFVPSNPNSVIKELNKTGPLIGIYPESKWLNRQINFNEADQIIFYTDGVTETQNNQNDFYDSDRFYQFVKANQLLNPTDLIAAVFKDLNQFTHSSEIYDDITLIVIKKHQ